MYMKENYFILDSLELVGIFMFCHILLLSLQVYNDQKYLSEADVKKFIEIVHIVIFLSLHYTGHFCFPASHWTGLH